MKKIGTIIIAAAILLGIGCFLGSAVSSSAAANEAYPAGVAGMVIESIESSSDFAAPDNI